MSRVLALVTTVVVSCPVWADDKAVTVNVKTVDGKPAVGAKAWVYVETFKEEAVAEPVPIAVNGDGILNVPQSTDPVNYRWIYVLDSSGQIGISFVPPERYRAAINEPINDVVLIDLKIVRGRITSADGKPVVGATVSPTRFADEIQGQRVPGGPSPNIPLPSWEQTRLSVKTDAQGAFQLPAPDKYAVTYRVKAEGYGESLWLAPVGMELETRLVKSGQVVISITGMESGQLKGESWRLNPLDDVKTKAVLPQRWQKGVFDGSSTVTVKNVVPGKYALVIDGQKNVPGLFEKPAAFEVASGQSSTVLAKFGPAAKATGKITDKNGKGIAKVQVFVYVTDGSNSNRLSQATVETDADGIYSVYGPTGWYQVYLQGLPDGYATPLATTPRNQLVAPVSVEIGKSQTVGTISLLDAVSFTARVQYPDGKPAVGAAVTSGGGFFGLSSRDRYLANESGTFTFPNLPPDDAISPRVRLGNAVNIPETFELAKHTSPAVIELSEGHAVTLIGRVIDAKGMPIAGSSVELRQNVDGVGRQAASSTRGMAARAVSDQDGRFTFKGMWPKDDYYLLAKANGYSQAEPKPIRGVAGQTQDFGEIKLTRASLAVKGTVVGPDAKPVAGVEVFGVDGPSRFQTTSAADGSFSLSGYLDGPGFVFAKKTGYRLVAKPVVPGDERVVTIELAKADGSPIAGPVIPPHYSAALNAFAKHSQTLIWDNRLVFNFGGNAIGHMALLDLPTAKNWRDEEFARTEGKTDHNRTITRSRLQVTLFDLAKNEPEAAFAAIDELRPENAFWESLRAANLMLPVDKAKALRFAEDAAVRARQVADPNRLYSLSKAADLMIRAGGTESGKAILTEAAQMASELAPDDAGRGSFVIGLVAADVAVHDAALSDALLNRLKNSSDYNRYVAATAARVATTDFVKAKEMLGRFKPSSSSYSQIARVKVAGAVVATRFDEAVKMVDEVDRGPYRVLGYIHLARLIAPTDKAKAVKLIDTAFDLLERNPEGFTSYMNYGSRSAFAVIALVRAKELGYPDVPQLVARFLAMRPVAKDAWSPKDLEGVTVNLAAALALVDPVAARQMLATLGNPVEYEAKALTRDRSWLFAVALADPERAASLADKLAERAVQKKGNAISQTGLVELGSILVAADRLKVLTQFGHFPHEIREDD